jgi:hypothetical protein
MKTSTIIATVVAGALLTAAGHAQDTNARPHLPSNMPRGPFEIVSETLLTEVGRQLKAAGASFDDLQVTVAEKRHNATPFKVSYTALRNFKGADGTTPEADGAFIMEYIGGGTWRGKLAGTPFTVKVGHTDNIDLPFVDDPAVIGEWASVDFVSDIAEFNPDQRRWDHELYLPGLTFLAGGQTAKPWLTWTKGLVLHHGDQTASRYEIKEIKGQTYLFFEWKSGDVMISGMKPRYYVLKKQAAAKAP